MTSSLRATVLSVVSMGGGVALAAVPAAILSIASHTYATTEQGFISVASTASMFIGQLMAAGIVEARLGFVSSERRTALPRWLAALGIVAAAAVTATAGNPVVLCVALPFLLSALEVGRSVAVAERKDTREIWSALLIGSGLIGGLAVAYLGGTWGTLPLVVGIAAAIVVRIVGSVPASSRPPASVTFWVVTDVGLTGAIYPLLNTLILAFIGPAAAVVFAAVSTVSGLLAIPLNFMRLRLLKAHSRLDIAVAVSAVAGCAVVIGILELTGVLGFVYAGPWTTATTVLPLTIACVWRAASIASTLPFAALRRAGHVRLLTLLRGACALVTLLVGAAVLPLRNVAVVFVVLLAGELAQAATYELARRRRSHAREELG